MENSSVLASHAQVMLVFPPPWLPIQPYIALPALQGALRQAGLGPVAIYDLNAHAWNDLLTGPHLSALLEKCVRCQIELGLAQSAINRDHCEQLAHAALVGPYVVQHVDEAKRVLRDPVLFYQYDRFAWSIRILMQALQLVSAAHYPTKWSFIEFSMHYRCNVPDMSEAASDRAENPFLSYFESHSIPRIEQAAPELVGISIMCQEQAIPGLTLASLIRQRMPQTRIVIGGAYFTGLVKEIHQHPELFQFADFFVVNEGESSLIGLVRAIAGNKEPHGVPNLLYRRSDRTFQSDFIFEDVKRLPSPDYSGLPWNLYLSPEPIFHLQTSRGCYWNQCTFCAQTCINMEQRYRQRAVDQVIGDMASLIEKHGARYFTFWDDSMSPATLRTMSGEIVKAGYDIRWTAITRFEKAFLGGEIFRDMVEAGCRQVEFGYESGVQRVLDLMHKGVDATLVLPILRAARKAGLSVTLLAMVGFPGETREEAERSLQFALDHADLIDHIYWGKFTLCKHSIVERSLDRYGVGRVPLEGELSLRFEWAFKSGTGGMDSAEAAQVAARHAARCDEAGITDTNARNGPHYLLYQDKFGLSSLPFTDRDQKLDLPRLGNARLSLADGLLISALPEPHGSGDCLVFHPQTGRVLRVTPRLTAIINACRYCPRVHDLFEELIYRRHPSCRLPEDDLAAALNNLIQRRVLVVRTSSEKDGET